MKVYVSEFAKENALAKSTSPNKLARALLDIVFTEEALKLCNTTGKNGAFENRKMLHQKGMRAIYLFVHLYAKDETNWLACDGWTKTVRNSVQKSMRQKLNEIKQNELRNKFRKQIL